MTVIDVAMLTMIWPLREKDDFLGFMRKETDLFSRLPSFS